MKNLDSFAAPVPSFNLQGETAIKTTAGASLSILISLLTLAFAIIKLDHLLLRKNPNLNTNESALQPGESYSVQDEDLMIAFAMEQLDTGFKDDPRYV